MTERLVFACSGSARSATAIRTLAVRHGAEVVALTLDLGQGQAVEEAHDRALEAGAVRAHVLDVREEFARDFVLPALQAGARREGGDPMALPLAHAIIARKLVDMAAIEDARTVAHGGAGTDRVRIAAAVRALEPGLRVLAVDGEGRGPAEAPPSGAVRANLWGREIDTDGAAPVPESLFACTTSLSAAPDAGAHVDIAFERGVPTAINGVPLALTELIESLSIIAGQHGIGRVAGLPDPDGPPRIHEIPAATVLHTAHDALATVAAAPGLARIRAECGSAYADCIWNGGWFTPLREALDAFTAAVQVRITGVVRVELLKGKHTITSCQAPCASAPPRTSNDVEGRVGAAAGALAAQAALPHP
ncbi:MAG: argininosuccinate synthase [Acidobacteria bacterium]|nr:argininosuccinate synthase [Acidobacteriota bacterium]